MDIVTDCHTGLASSIWVHQENVMDGQQEKDGAGLVLVSSQEARALETPRVCLKGGNGWTETTCPLPSYRRWGRSSWRRLARRCRRCAGWTWGAWSSVYARCCGR